MNNSAAHIHFHQWYGSNINVTFASDNLARHIKGWEVLDEKSGNDHNYIRFSVERASMVAAPKKLGKWATSKLVAGKLEAAILAEGWAQYEEEQNDVKADAEKLYRKIASAYNVTMPQQGSPRKKGDIYW